MTSSSSSTSALPPIPSNAVLYQRAVRNPIGVTAASSNNIGYLSTNRTQLEVVGQLTPQDSTDMYNFTYQNTGPVTLTLRNVDGKAPARIALLDGSGSRVIADSGGTPDQKKAYADLTSKSGLDLSNTKYVVKVTYSADGDKTKNQNYGIQIDSGTTFQSDYRTLASATTVQNTLLAGGSLGYNSLTSTASMLTNVSQGYGLNIFGVLSVFPTNIFA